MGFSVGLLFAPLVLSAQSTTLAAGVAEAGTGRPLARAEVVIVDLRRLAHTDSLGQALIANVPSGRHRVRVRKEGHAAADLELLFQGDSLGQEKQRNESPRRNLRNTRPEPMRPVRCWRFGPNDRHQSFRVSPLDGPPRSAVLPCSTA